MKIIELTEDQFRNYSGVHSRRNHLQTIEYARMKKEDNYESLFLGLVDDNENIIAGSLILSKKINNKNKQGYAPWGFLIDYNNKDLLSIFTTKLKEYLRKKDFVYLQTNPNIRFKVYDKKLTIIDGNANNINILKSCGYNFAGYKDEFSKYSIYLKGEDSINAIYNKFNRSTKRNIEFCLNMGITVHKGNLDNFDLFYDLVKNTSTKSMDFYRKLSSYFNTDYNKFEIFFAKLNPEVYINNFQYLLKQEQEKNNKISNDMKNDYRASSSKLINQKMKSDRLIEKYKKEIIRATNVYKIFPDGIIIGTCGIIRNNKSIYFIVDGYNKQLNYIHSVPLIKWEIIKIYHTVNYREFYLGPVHSDLNNKEYQGLLQSKLGLGGEIVEYPGNFNLITNKYLYTIYSNFTNMGNQKK